MTRTTLATAIVFLSLSATSALAQTWSGTLSDSMCAAKHEKATKSDIACAQKCFNGGSPAVLVVDGKVFKIDNQDAIKKDEVGHKVVVKGKLSGDSIHVNSVKMAM